MQPSMLSTLLSRLFFGLAACAIAIAITLGIVNVARAQSITVMPSNSQTSGISVCGHGTANTNPNQAEIAVGVQASASTAEAARGQAARAMNAVLAALASQGVARADIQTDYFAIEPEYSYGSGSPYVTGYSASNNVTVTIHAVDKTGIIVDAVTQAGGNNVVVTGIQFSTGDPAQTLAQAQQNALDNAYQQAKKAASAAGVTLGAPLSIQLDGCGGTSSIEAAASVSGRSSSNPTTPIAPGQVEVTADVEVVYAIAG
jgi:uncharacterized protein